ncbi:hypothetical protein [Rugosibacter aromaticivorans]|uniref:hypothetical protein n=1 Tax=Rugosibacter aromaticivorans TaxID=1565605 RepID=UPI00192A41FA|nr:hypothetical protein [Rugosibacter aromaticivorans]
MPHKLRAQQRSSTDAHNECGKQQQYDAAFIATQNIFGIRWKLGKEQRTMQPEPRDAENGRKGGTVFAGKGQVAPGLGQRACGSGVNSALAIQR